MPKYATPASFKPGKEHTRWGGGCYDYWHRKIRKQYNVPKNLVVHHIDHNYKNNNRSNLLFIPQSEHATIHNKERTGRPISTCKKRILHNTIMKLTNKGFSSRRIARTLDIGKTTVLRSRRLKKEVKYDAE